MSAKFIKRNIQIYGKTNSNHKQIIFYNSLKVVIKYIAMQINQIGFSKF